MNGLAQGTRLSSGVPVSEAGWELALHDFGAVYVYAPKEFIGVMNGVIDLLSPGKRIIDSRAVRLEWIAKADLLQREACHFTTECHRRCCETDGPGRSCIPHAAGT